MPLMAVIIGSEPKALITIYDSDSEGDIALFPAHGWKPLAPQEEKARLPWTGSKMAVPIEMHTLWFF
jgi:hypothetical protein